MFSEESLEETNDIPRLLSGEIKEIFMAEVFTLEESISELKQNLKRKFHVSKCASLTFRQTTFVAHVLSHPTYRVRARKRIKPDLKRMWNFCRYTAYLS